jgi:hypothetical protein
LPRPFNMVAAILLVSLIGPGTVGPHWEALWHGRLPGGNPRQAPVIADNGAFAIECYDSISHLHTYRFDPARRRFQEMFPGTIWSDQRDCGAGLCSVGAGRKVTTFDVASGKKISEVVVPTEGWIRVGSVIQGWLTWNPTTYRYFDARKGLVLAERRDDALIWDSPTLRLTLKPGSEIRTFQYTLCRFAPTTLLQVAETGVIGVESYDFEGLVGNPETPPFVVEGSWWGVGVAKFCYTIVDASFRSRPFVGHIWDISPLGILSGTWDYHTPPEGAKEYQDIGCFERVSAKLRWRKKFGRGELRGSSWDGANVRLESPHGYTLVNGTTGAKIRFVPEASPSVVSRDGLSAFGRDPSRRGEFVIFRRSR